MNRRSFNLLLALALISCAAFSRAEAQWYNYNDASITFSVLNDGNAVWVGSDGGGLIKYDKTAGTKTYFNRATSGLRSMHITTMLKDGSGTIWIGTGGGGLMKFDGGSTWTSYKANNSGLPDNIINALSVAANGHIWVATQSGLADFDGANGWTVYTADNSGLPENKITAVAAAPNGTVWAGTLSKGLAKFSGGNWTAYRKATSGLPSDSITTINANVFGKLWIGVATGKVTQLEEPATWNTIDFSLPQQIGLEVTYRPTFEIREGANNTILFSTYTGLVIWDGSTAVRYPKGNFSNNANAVYSAFADNDGKVWCATQQGISHDTTGSAAFKRISVNATGMLGNNIDGMMVDKSGAVYMGSLGALMKFDRTSWQTWGPNVFHYRAIRMPAQDSAGNYWVTTGEGVDKSNGNNFQTQSISGAGRKFDPILTDKNGNVWMGGDGGLAMAGSSGITVYNNGNTPQLPAGGINALALDKNGTTVWIGTEFSGVVKFDGSTWTTYSADDHPEMGSNLIRALAVDPASGALFIGTADAGFSKYDGSTFTLYNTVNSQLPNDNVTALAVDQYGALWIGTGAQGLVKLQGTKWNIYSNENSGITDDHITSVAVSNDQQVWVGTTGGGLVRYDERSVLGVARHDAEGSAHMLVAGSPNPFSGTSMLHVALPARANVRLSVVDARGTEVALLHDGAMEAGDHLVPFNADGLPSGAYFARIATGGTTETLPIVVAR